jgi:hypothetical protein
MSGSPAGAGGRANARRGYGTLHHGLICCTDTAQGMEHRPSGRGRDSRCRRHRWGTDPRGQLIQEAGVLPNPELIAEAVNVVVSICRTKTGGRVEEVAAVKGWSAGDGFHIARLA